MLRCRLLSRGPFLDLAHRCPARARRTRILHLARACRHGRRPGLPDERFDRKPDADTADISARRDTERRARLESSLFLQRERHHPH